MHWNALKAVAARTARSDTHLHNVPQETCLQLCGALQLGLLALGVHVLVHQLQHRRLPTTGGTVACLRSITAELSLQHCH